MRRAVLLGVVLAALCGGTALADANPPDPDLQSLVGCDGVKPISFVYVRPDGTSIGIHIDCVIPFIPFIYPLRPRGRPTPDDVLPILAIEPQRPRCDGGACMAVVP